MFNKSLLAAACVVSALLSSPAAAQTPKEPYSCQMYREAERKCSYVTIGKCYVQDEVERRRKECLRDGGHP